MKRNKILIVDDDRSLLKAINYTLRGESYEVLTSNNGKEALDILKKDNEILVLLIDLNMPLFTGVEFLAEIKNFNRPLQRIVMTATDNVLTPSKAKDLRVLTYLSKPYKDYSLLFTIESAFNKLELEEAKQWKNLALIATETIHLIGNKISPISRRIDEISQIFNELYSKNQIDKNNYEKIINDIEIIKDGAQQTHAIKSDLIDGSINKQPIDIISILNKVISESKKEYQYIDFTFHINIESSLILADEKIIKRILSYIIKNAVQSIEDKNINQLEQKKNTPGKLNVKTSIYDSMLEIYFIDNGCGINNDDLYKIFEPFFTTKGADRGSGVGLYFCKRMMEDLNGEIKIKDTVIGEGTTVLLRFPILL